MSEREFYVRIDHELVKVSKEVYQEYYRGRTKGTVYYGRFKKGIDHH